VEAERLLEGEPDQAPVGEDGLGALDGDAIDSIRADYRETGTQGSNRAYGYFHRSA
jgi:hypothetical protein